MYIFNIFKIILYIYIYINHFSDSNPSIELKELSETQNMIPYEAINFDCQLVA